MCRLWAGVVLVVALWGCGSPEKQTNPLSDQDGGTDCVPTSCQALGANCGTILDGCGGTLECGSCGEDQTCGGGGTPNVCGSGTCTPKTCANLGAQCGMVSDECGTVLTCGTCSDLESCDGDNRCAQKDQVWAGDWNRLTPYHVPHP